MQGLIATGGLAALHRLGRRGFGGAVRLLYPPQCVSCDALVDDPFGLCPACWRDTAFIGGAVCTACGAPVSTPGDEPDLLCEDCVATPRPWVNGRAALAYRDNARRIVLALKHGDRLDLARPAAHWLFRAARPILHPGMLVVPIPLHRMRLWQRRYNQAALLSAGLARLAGLEHCPDALIRARRTGSQENRSRAARFAMLAGAMSAHPGRRGLFMDREVLLVDDVMTSGATFAEAARACHAAGAKRVSVLALARVAKDA